ncbi:iron chelate uptake ABC transporter family permease subunit [Paenibacillus sp. Y412MC10]|uniref:iron chelate uptake ABC transporter family permease subunit n=1 Tax=Geobacillus sp. (strain Y412MC10) TaxID=481743 RepID=UPI000178A11F|nr:iron chelate uptake ABC transporter family permease subunit [Paenibacillus sp. Y412MC10]
MNEIPPNRQRYEATWNQVLKLTPWTVLCGGIAWLNARHLNIHTLGEGIATGMGAAVQRQRLWLLLIAVGLAGSSVALVGAVGFIGLIGPHIAKRISRHDTIRGGLFVRIT